MGQDKGRDRRERAKNGMVWVGCPHLWYLMKAGKVVPSSQCRKVERGTGKNSSMMSSVAAQPRAPDTLRVHGGLKADSCAGKGTRKYQVLTHQCQVLQTHVGTATRPKCCETVSRGERDGSKMCMHAIAYASLRISWTWHDSQQEQHQLKMNPHVPK